MFGVALELKVENFRRIFKTPVPILTGLVAQFILLPAGTFLLILLIQPTASVALGMILISACPGGNVSNFFSMMSKGNVALSVSITAISTALCIFMTPFNLALWSNFYAPTRAILQEVNLEMSNVVITIFMVLLIPLILGMLLSAKRPDLSSKISGHIRKMSLVIFGAFVLGALAANFDIFLHHIAAVILLVTLHNGMALLIGYFSAKSIRLPLADRRSISIETGIQNSGLGLILIFDFFQGLGGMAIVAAWWGIWHLTSGLMLSWYWSKKELVEDLA
ncbi:bile acid:sodium symporter family protein [Reichenbachiella sp. MALMAid0571]|uniref:bile acid:sodium symporter family protein n=1 Tax=Reichenbachiella sp. MALMAid0571 TaxID=3143939 RepID=UPI0032DEF31A